MGGVKAHGKGIQVTFLWNGKRFRPTIGIPPTQANLKYAARLKGEVERAIALGQYSLEAYAKHFPSSRVARSAPKIILTPTFREMSERWLAASRHLSKGTLIKYNQALNFWLGNIGDDPIDAIKYSTIAALANNQGWGAKNRNNILIPLRQVLEMAFLDGIIEAIPSARIKNAKVQKEPPDPLTAEEIINVLTHMTKYDAQIVNVMEFSLFSGMRPSEVIALRWGDIDFNGKQARVKRARTFGIIHETKTYKVRDVELNIRSLAALNRQKALTFLKDDGVIFENPVTGEAYNDERPLRRSYWNPTLKALGMRARPFYQTRHTYATLNLMAGANPMWVAKQMGHANMQMILTVYSKWIDGADRSKESSKLDSLFKSTATRMPQIKV